MKDIILINLLNKRLKMILIKNGFHFGWMLILQWNKTKIYSSNSSKLLEFIF